MIRRTVISSFSPFASATALVSLSASLAVGCSSTDTIVNTGDAGTTTTTDGSVVTTTDSLTFTPSNVNLTGFDLSKAADMDITSNCTFQFDATSGITDCGSDDALFQYEMQSDQTGIGVYVMKSLHIEPGVTVTVNATRPIVLVSLTTALIQGTIDVSAGSTPTSTSAGGFVAPNTGDLKGGGLGGGAPADDNSAASGGGNCGVGGTGNITTVGGKITAGGMATGSATIIPLVGGSSGGTGAEAGGTGGGALQIVAGTSITLDTAGFLAAGGGGGNASGDETQQAGGGGAGGAILLEAPTVTASGSIAANGGGGGGGGDSTHSASNGKPAAAVLSAALGGGAYGGAGSAGTSINGGNGLAALATFDPGAGGGGAGRIRINTTSGAATISGMFSPAVGTSCVTQGTLSK